ncbi:hypothetical protein [Cupriavidus sp. 8B]
MKNTGFSPDIEHLIKLPKMRPQMRRLPTFRCSLLVLSGHQARFASDVQNQITNRSDFFLGWFERHLCARCAVDTAPTRLGTFRVAAGPLRVVSGGAGGVAQGAFINCAGRPVEHVAWANVP